MRIIGIEVYGYGKLEKLELSGLSRTIQVFYGKNEAGKSTLMSFIHSIFFGFPTKQQQELRYEPKNGGKYGGKLILVTKDEDTIVIERVPGKATGDVTIYYPDGTVGGEEQLKILFNGLDKALYKNIFSFNIHDIQHVHRLSAEDLGTFLFSASSIGTDALLKLDQKLTKELEGLYKPNGKKPILNTQIAELRELKLKVEGWKEKNTSYNSLLQAKISIENLLLQCELRKKAVIEKERRYEILYSIQPLIKDKELYQLQLQALNDYEPFPVDGIMRLENILSSLKPYEAQLSSLQNRKKDLNENLNSKKMELKALALKDKIVNAYMLKKWYLEMQHAVKQCQFLLIQTNEEIIHLRESLHLEANEPHILAMNTSINAKENLKKLSNWAETLHHRKNFLDERFSIAKYELEQSESKIKELEKGILSDEDRTNLQEKIRNMDNYEQLIREKEQLDMEKRKLAAHIDVLQGKRGKKKLAVALMLISLSSFFIILIGYFIWNQQWLLSGTMILLLFILILSRKYYGAETDSLLSAFEADNYEIEKRQALINEIIEKNKVDDVTMLKERHAEDRRLRHLLELEADLLVKNEQQFETVLKEYTKWERERISLDIEVNNKKQEYHLPKDFNGESLLDALQKIERLKEKIREKNKLQSQLQSFQTEIKQFEQKVDLIKDVIGSNQEDVLEILDEADQKLQAEIKRYNYNIEQRNKLRELETQINDVLAEVQHLQAEINQLFILAKVSSEEEFRAKSKRYDEANEIKHKITLIDTQLHVYKEVLNDYSENDNYEQLVAGYKQEIVEIEAEQTELQKKLAELSFQINELEEGGSYSELFHQYERKHSVFHETAKKWATYAVAKDILTKTISKYREIRIPNLLKDAESYLKILTNDRYNKIFSSSDREPFIIRRNDGMRFKPNELSQATAEQVYIAFRFSLAKSISAKYAYPIIIDDSFVNFDAFRLHNALSLVRNLSTEHQVLYFTCHDHVKKLFHHDEIIVLQ